MLHPLLFKIRGQLNYKASSISVADNDAKKGEIIENLVLKII